MALHLIRELKNKHPNSDIYVVGSGASFGYINKSFFVNKITICVNHTIDHINKAKELYLVAKEPNEEMQKSAKDHNASIVMCKHHSGLTKNPLNKICYPDITYIFEARYEVIPKKNNPVALERSSSTIVTGLHLAAHLGAKNIIIVGHDCGTIDGNMHIENYNKKNAVMKGGAYRKWMRHNKVENKTIKAKELLKRHWNIEVYSLNPFINFNLEGHDYQKF
jgi:hypothetical protein